MLLDIEEVAREYITYRGGSEFAEYGVLPVVIDNLFIDTFAHKYPLKLLEWYYNFTIDDCDTLLAAFSQSTLKNSIWYLNKIMPATKVYLSIATIIDRWNEKMIAKFIELMNPKYMGEIEISLKMLIERSISANICCCISKYAHQTKLYHIVWELEKHIFAYFTTNDQKDYVTARIKNFVYE